MEVPALRHDAVIRMCGVLIEGLLIIVGLLERINTPDISGSYGRVVYVMQDNERPKKWIFTPID